jgi:hypothetical protein
MVMSCKRTFGFLYKWHLIIPNCPFCGRAHFHGNADHKIGDVTHRVAHCPECPPGELRSYDIEIIGEMDGYTFRRLWRRQ